MSAYPLNCLKHECGREEGTNNKGVEVKKETQVRDYSI
jgi:hypothetical protein